MKKLKALVWPVVMIGLTLLATGCDTVTSGTFPFTASMWNDWPKEHYEPAPEKEVKMFQSRCNGDVLVQYTEEREKTGSMHTRAYYALANEGRVMQSKKPRFVRLKSMQGLEEIPVEPAGKTNLSAPTWAELTPQEDGFRIFKNGVATDWQPLPVYRDKRDQAERVMLMPVAVTTDAAVVATVAGIVYLVIRAGGTSDPCLNCGCNN